MTVALDLTHAFLRKGFEAVVSVTMRSDCSAQALVSPLAITLYLPSNSLASASAFGTFRSQR